LIVHLDIPQKSETPYQNFRRDPEFLYGEGIGSSRGPVVMLEFALRSLKTLRLLDRLPLGVLCYADEGVDATYSARAIADASSMAGRVLVLRPGNPGGKAIDERRGEALYRLLVEGRPTKLGQGGRTIEPLLWLSGKLAELHELSSREQRIAVSATGIQTEAFPLLLPHRVTAQLEVSYYDHEKLTRIKEQMGHLLVEKGLRVNLEEYSNRPPMRQRKVTRGLVRELKEIARRWDIQLEMTSSLWPSVAGLVPDGIPVVCGMGPLAEHLYTPQERIQRISLIQRTLLLTQYLLSLSEI
jgi:D-alanine-D-alanine ligase